MGGFPAASSTTLSTGLSATYLMACTVTDQIRTPVGLSLLTHRQNSESDETAVQQGNEFSAFHEQDIG